MAFVFPTFRVELMLDGVTWADLTTDVRAAVPITAHYGMSGSGPDDRVAATGEWVFALNNAETNSARTLGYYAPSHASCRAGFARNIWARLSFTYGGVTYYKFVGRLKTIAPAPGEYGARITECHAVDYIDDLATANLSGSAIAPMLNARGDQALTALLAAMPTQPKATSVDTGVAEWPYIFVNGAGGVVNGLQEVQRIAASEFGWIFVKGDTSAGGVLCFRNCRARATAVVDAATLTDASFAELEAADSTADVLNTILVTVHPRAAQAGATLFAATSAVKVPAGTIITVNAPYRDPSQTVSVGTERVAGISMAAMVAGTDYKANSASDGSGVDETANITVSASFAGTGATITLTNPLTVDVWMVNGSGTPLLQLRGTGLYDYEAPTLQAVDASSQDAYGVRTFAFDMSYENDTSRAQNVANYIRDQRKNPFTSGFPTRLQFLANKSDALMIAALAREVGDRVHVQEAATGISTSCFINGIELELRPGSILMVTWTLAPADPVRQWQLGIAGYSEVGSTTHLAYL